jgi:hypothetical protein
MTPDELSFLAPLNCSSWSEMGQRALFQDWLTNNMRPWPTPAEREALWDAFKRGATIVTHDGGVSVL